MGGGGVGVILMGGVGVILMGGVGVILMGGGGGGVIHSRSCEGVG